MRNSNQATETLNSAELRQPLPVFQAPSSNIPAPRRLLLISFHFPPGGAAGALRWQKLSHFAAERGWGLDVISLHPSGLEKTDNTRLADLPPGTRVFGVPMPELLLERIVERQIWRWYRSFRPVKPAIADIPEPGAQARAAQHPGLMAPTAFRDRFLRRLNQVVGIARRGYFAWMDYYTHGAWADDVTNLGLRLLESENIRSDRDVRSAAHGPRSGTPPGKARPDYPWS